VGGSFPSKTSSFHRQTASQKKILAPPSLSVVIDEGKKWTRFVTPAGTFSESVCFLMSRTVYGLQTWGFKMRMAFLTASITCAIPFCAWAGISLYQGGAAEQTGKSFAVERTSKSDRIVGAVIVRGEYLPTISVEVAGKSDAVVTVRGRDGRLLYRLDPARRMTIVAKGLMQTPTGPPSGHRLAPREPEPTTKGLPGGCEGAFSPYVEFGMANVIARCVSELTENAQVASR
jgi:hypothetical protein